jgi:hypothetical protein
MKKLCVLFLIAAGVSSCLPSRENLAPSYRGQDAAALYFHAGLAQCGYVEIDGEWRDTFSHDAVEVPPGDHVILPYGTCNPSVKIAELKITAIKGEKRYFTVVRKPWKGSSFIELSEKEFFDLLQRDDDFLTRKRMPGG